MEALTPVERAEQRIRDLTDMRERIEAEIRRTRASLKKSRRRNPRPECSTEAGYQRHYREGEICAKCKAAHREHERNRYALEKARRENGIAVDL